MWRQCIMRNQPLALSGGDSGGSLTHPCFVVIVFNGRSNLPSSGGDGMPLSLKD